MLRKCDSGAQWNTPMRHIEHCPTLEVVRCLIPRIETRPTKRVVSISIRPVDSGVKLHEIYVVIEEPVFRFLSVSKSIRICVPTEAFQVFPFLRVSAQSVMVTGGRVGV